MSITSKVPYQPREADQLMLDEIVRRVLTVASPQRIILFGSAATQTMNRDSDIDLLILTDDLDDARKEIDRISDALTGIGRPFDVIVMTVQRFAETRNVVGGIAYPAHKYGRVLYETR